MILFVVRYLVTLFVLGLSTIAIADQASVPVDAGLAAANPEKTPNPPLDPSLTRLINEIKKDSEFYPADAAKALAHLGEVEAAKVILGKARIVTEYPSAMLEIGKVQAELGERHAALKTMLRARQLFLREEQSDSGVAEDLTRVAKEQRKLGDLAAAEKSFEEAMRSVEGLNPDKRQFALEHIIEARAELGDFGEALKIVPSIEDLNRRIECLGLITTKNDKIPLSDLEQILLLIDSAKRLPHELEDGLDMVKWNADGRSLDILLSIATRAAKANDRANFRKCLERAEAIPEAFGELSNHLWGFIGTLVKLGEIGEATRLMERIEGDKGGIRYSFLEKIAAAHEERGDWVAALKTRQDSLQATATNSERSYVLMSIAEVHIKAGNRDLALKTLQQALIAGRDKEGRGEGGPRDELTKKRKKSTEGIFEGKVAALMAKAGHFSEAIQLANTIQEKQLQGHALALISGEQADAGDIKGALQTANSIKPLKKEDRITFHLFDQDTALRGIISTQAGAGDLEGAFTTADRLKESRWMALLSMAESYGKRIRPRQ